MACPWHAPIGLPCAWGVGATQNGVTGIAWNRPVPAVPEPMRARTIYACEHEYNACYNLASSLTLNESIRTPKSMHGACHAMLHARAMPCRAGSNSGGGCRKTPDFGLVEGSRSPLKACRNAKSRMRMRHDGACHVTDPPVPFLRNGARGKTKRRERSGERTGNRWDRKSENTLRKLRHLDSSLPLTVIAKAQALLPSEFFALLLSLARTCRVALSKRLTRF